MDLGVVRLDPAGFFDMTEREHGVFDGTYAVQTPLGVAEGLSVLAFDGRFGREIRHELGAEAHVGIHVFPRHDDDAARQPVTHRVQGGFLLSFFSAGSGGASDRRGICSR